MGVTFGGISCGASPQIFWAETIARAMVLTFISVVGSPSSSPSYVRD